MKIKNKNLSSLKFRKILNDLKRRPVDAAKDLNITERKINHILNGKEDLDISIINKAISIWPINHSDLFPIIDDTTQGYKKFSKKDSDKTSRVMYRKGKEYYHYKDTVMSKVSTFRPEWIQELVVVKNNSPHNPNVVYNNGHFLHQFTYFIGPVNFYYIDKNNKKKVAKMNTGDSMHISPYIPHSFTTRKNKENKLGLILALTYSGNIDSDVLNELSAIGKEYSSNFNLNFLDKKNIFFNNLKYFLNISSIDEKFFEKKLKIKLNKLKKNTPSIKIIQKISDVLNVNVKDLIPPTKFDQVKIQTYNKSKKWNLSKNNKDIYKVVELTNVSQLPCSKAIELEVLTEKKHSLHFEIPCHQYVYNVGKTSCSINFKNKKEKLNPEDTIYIKPNVRHSFTKKSKLLILRIAGKLHNDNLYHLSTLSKKNYERLIVDNKPWFN